MLNSKFSAAAIFSLIAVSSETIAAGPGTGALMRPAFDNVVSLAAARAKKPTAHIPGGSAKLASKGRVVKDTCPGNDKACINDLVKNCDKAGGGLSTWEDGSVDCYVVGIHDQP